MRKVENEKKPLDDCFQLFIQNLKHLQHGLAMNFQNDDFFHNKLITACRDVPVCRFACYKPSDIVVGLINDIWSSILTFNKAHQAETFFTDRRYHEGKRPYNRNQPQPRYQPRPRGRYGRYNRAKKTCFVCKKEGCWSTNHSQEERDAQRDRVKNSFRKRYNDNEAERHTRTYIVGYEGTDPALGAESDEVMDIEEEIEALMIDFESPEDPESEEVEGVSSTFLTDFGAMNGPEIITTDLINRSFSHCFGPHPQSETVALINQPETVPLIKGDINRAWAFVSTERYTEEKFFGIMIDTGASRYSTIGYGQFLAYNKITETVINLTKSGAVHVQFDIRSISFIKFIIITTSIDQAEFHVVKIDTFFLLCLADLDRLNVYYNNINDTLIQEESTTSVICRFGHLFLL